MLPCATSLYGKENQFYGVLGMDVTFSDIIEDNLKREGAAGVVESFLLDDRGRIIVRSQLEADVQEHAKNPALKLEPFPVPEVTEAIVNGESGLHEVEHDGESRIIVFYQMSSLKWYYVEEVDMMPSLIQRADNITDKFEIRNNLNLFRISDAHSGRI